MREGQLQRDLLEASHWIDPPDTMFTMLANDVIVVLLNKANQDGLSLKKVKRKKQTILFKVTPYTLTVLELITFRKRPTLPKEILMQCIKCSLQTSCRQNSQN